MRSIAYCALLVSAGCTRPADGDASDAATDSWDSAADDAAPDDASHDSADVRSTAPYWGTQPPPHTTTIALSRDARRAYVVQPDGDAVSVIDVMERRLLAEIPLGPRPTVDVRGNYHPAVSPRALALSRTRATIYVACETSGEVVAIDETSLRVRSRVGVCPRAVGVLLGPDESRVYVACNADQQIAEIDAGTLAIMATVPAPAPPWSLAWRQLARGVQLVAGAIVSDAVGVFDVSPTLRLAETWQLAPIAPGAQPQLANGVGRAAYDLAQAPGVDRPLYAAYRLVATQTAQPVLDFESTVFPAVGEPLRPGGEPTRPMTTDSRIAGVDGEFGDVVSGPRALAVLPGAGRYALLVAENSEDLLVVDLRGRAEVSLLRPLPGDWPQGIAVSEDGMRGVVDQRASGDVAVLDITHDAIGVPAVSVAAVVPARTRDPMPDQLRLGQRVFHSANSSEFSTTTNFWFACATCHPEGATLGATLRFSQGPRDIPTNTGGLDGFLFRAANRNSIMDYRRTVEVEQGGDWPDADSIRTPQLRAVEQYVLFAIPDPPRPRTDPARVARGRAVFARSDSACATCHSGPSYTDSGAGNPALDYAGEVRLHDVGTCVTTGYADRASLDVSGRPREPCRFDTPTLRAIYASPPYLHDGSAATLRDVLTTRNRAQRHGRTDTLDADEIDALVEFLRSL